MKTKEKFMLKILIDGKERNKKSVKLLSIENNTETLKSEKTGDIDFVTAINELLKENSLTIDMITEFSFEDGNGSFTGIKNAAAIANVLQWAVNNVRSEKLRMPDYGGNQPNIQK